MSMSISVLIGNSIPSPQEVQRVVSDLGFDLRIADLNAAFDSASGFRPMTFGPTEGPVETGVEMYVGGAKAFARDNGVEVDPRFDRVVSFRWGSKMDECYSALAVCAAIAKAANGAIFADYQGSFVTAEEVVAEAEGASKLLKR